MKETTIAAQILERLKIGLDVRSDSELGRLLGVSQQAVYNARTNNKLPDSWIRIAGERFGLSTDWLYFGQGAMLLHKEPVPPVSQQREAIDEESLPQEIQEFILTAEARFQVQLKAHEAAALRERVALEKALEAKDQTIQSLQEHLSTYKAMLAGQTQPRASDMAVQDKPVALFTSEKP